MLFKITEVDDVSLKLSAYGLSGGLVIKGVEYALPSKVVLAFLALLHDQRASAEKGSTNE